MEAFFYFHDKPNSYIQEVCFSTEHFSSAQGADLIYASPSSLLQKLVKINSLIIKLPFSA